MFKKIHLALVLLSLSLLLIAAAPAKYGPNEGTMRGAAFLDSNRNGVMDPGEEGLGWVWFTISMDGYSHMYHSEWQTVDSAGNQYATGYFGPAPLPSGNWHVTLHVPDGYQATTPIEQTVYVPGADGGHVGEVYFGLYPASGGAATGSFLPVSGLNNASILVGAVVILVVGVLVTVGLAVIARRKS